MTSLTLKKLYPPITNVLTEYGSFKSRDFSEIIVENPLCGYCDINKRIKFYSSVTFKVAESYICPACCHEIAQHIYIVATKCYQVEGERMVAILKLAKPYTN